MKVKYIQRPRSHMVSQSSVGKHTLTEEVVPPARPKRLKVGQRFFLIQLLLFSVLTLILAGIQVVTVQQRTREEYGERALVISQMVANVPDVVEYLSNPEARIAINPLMEHLREQVHADFLVVGNRLGIRYAHPFPEEITHHILSGNSKKDVLAEDNPVEIGEGDLQNFIWGKASVHDADGFVTGMVSTGFLLPNVRSVSSRVVSEILPWYTLGVVFALVSSTVISRRIRREMFNLEPEQIASLVHQHRLVLGALQEGVVVIAEQGQVLLANGQALHFLNLRESTSLLDSWPEYREVHQSHQREFEAVSLMHQDRPVVISRYPLPHGHFVLVIRDREEVMRVAEELTQVRQYVALLRSQNHEFMNRLHTIGGLIQLQKPELALEVVRDEVRQHHQMQDILHDIEVPQVAALLIGKHERARELAVGFEVDPLSHLQNRWNKTAIQAMTLTLGNLIENAFEAMKDHSGTVRVLIAEDPDGVQIEVHDQGDGIPGHVQQSLFDLGVSSKGPERGYGLHLVQKQLQLLGGNIEHFRQEDVTVFRASIPFFEVPHDPQNN